MSSEALEQTETTSFVEGSSVKDKMADVAKVNGVGEESAGSASESGSSSKPKENGDKHRSSSGHGDGHSSHKSSSSSKHHSSSSDKHRSSSSSKHREGGGSSSSSSKHKESSSSSSSKHRDGHSSSSSSSKHKDGSSGGSSKHSSSSSSKHKDGSSSSSSRDKEKSSSSSSSSRHKEGSSSSSSRHKDGSSSSSRDKESSSSKHRDGHSSSSSKDKSSSSSSSDKHRDKSKESSKDKHKSSSSSSRQDGDKHRSSSSKNESKHSSSSSSKKKDGEIKVKEEPETNSVAPTVKPETNGHVEIKKEEPASPVKLKEERLPSPVKVKNEEPSSPVKQERRSVSPAKRASVKSDEESDDEDDVPLSARKKEARPQKRPKEESDYEEEEENEEDDEDADSDVPLSARANKAKKLKLDKKKPTPVKAKTPTPVKAEPKASSKKVKKEKQEVAEEPPKKKKKGEEEQEVWKWWEEERVDESVKWNFLEHKGPVFAPNYEPLPKNVKFYYEGKPMPLRPETEEVATFYGRMLDHEYTTRDVFNNNFMKDWRKVMSSEEKAKITDVKKCNFTEILDHFKKKSEERKNMSKEEKQAIKKENEEIVKIYGFCTIDHHKEKIGNFKIEPPGLFRGRGDHPKQGMLKKRVNPEDVIINCSKDSKIPEPPAGHKWKEVRHDNTVTWLASWNENIQGATKYVMLNAASRLKLALRAGNEKEEGESADTVGCCSLRVEHLKLHEEKGGKNYVVEFDFLGKDSIRYQNSIPVEKRVFKNLQLFMENKQAEDDLFDRLNTTKLNKHLQDLMEGLTAKVFRTYNASKTLSEQLELLTNPDDVVAAKMLSYNRANRAVAILCNHQRAVPKTFEKSMENLQNKIDAKKEDIKKVKKEIKGIKADYKQAKSVKTKNLYDNKKKALTRLEEQLNKLEVQATDKDENKEIALGTSKLNYLDPRISVAWCKKHEVPIEKVYNKTQRDKFRWAIDMATEHFKF
ncbi:DNA topoisomerase 1 [Elysia marginata]|uniref:DNA topoisomerase 1 n=1 Tax=Elysia marginata TaxID=1093978 RepID=A0AAV4JTR0_9GAST|nr:DNA topoisomerase 1 [Elysia marginata]